MQTLLDFVVSFMAFLEDLELFFFSPLSELASIAAIKLGVDEGSLAGTAFETIISGLISLFPGFSEITLAGLLLGSGLTFFLLWRLVKFLIGLFN